MSSIVFQSHDHLRCIAEGVAAAERRCAEEKLRFTRTRRRVLEILFERHRAIGAYEILDRLRAEGLGSQPPVAYRALNFLAANGLAHRIERLNAYVACAHPDRRHMPAFLICRSCGQIEEAEADSQEGELVRAAKAVGFSIEHSVREAEGLCPACTRSEAKPR